MHKILVVDDEEHCRKLLAAELLDNGYEVIQTSKGREAANIIKNDDPDLVVLDIKLEDCSGLDVLEEIRSFNYSLPIILYSAGSVSIVL